MINTAGVPTTRARQRRIAHPSARAEQRSQRPRKICPRILLFPQVGSAYPGHCTSANFPPFSTQRPRQDGGILD